MARHLWRRILLFIPTLVVISLLSFLLSVLAPGDPVDSLLGSAQGDEVSNAASGNIQQEKQYWRHKLGLDLPVFYCSISNLATPDTLYRVTVPEERECLGRLISMYGNWKEIAAYRRAVLQFQSLTRKFEPDTLTTRRLGKDPLTDLLDALQFEAGSLLRSWKPLTIAYHFNLIDHQLRQLNPADTLQQGWKRLQQKYAVMLQASTPWKYYIPAIHFYGRNQYHRWLFGDGGETSYGILRGDFGVSLITRRPVMQLLQERLPWTIFFTFISVLLAYLISIPLGAKAAAHSGSRFDRISSIILFLLYSMPGFWVATLLLMVFANPDLLPWFPVSGIKPVEGIPAQAGWWEWLRLTLPHLVLPTLAYTYSSFAFISRMTRTAVMDVYHQDYIRTAFAKGLSARTVLYKHALRNALLPLITVFSNLFPAIVGGSVILETIFNIPGMGSEIYTAIGNHDYPVIVAVFTLTGLLTLVGYLVADLLYAWADPRISFSNR